MKLILFGICVCVQISPDNLVYTGCNEEKKLSSLSTVNVLLSSTFFLLCVGRLCSGMNPADDSRKSQLLISLSLFFFSVSDGHYKKNPKREGRKGFTQQTTTNHLPIFGHVPVGSTSNFCLMPQR